jgi:hypothetical protein
MNKFCMLVVMVFWAEVVWPLCSAGETIALISGSGERAPDGVVIAELESSMLADPALTIVEREHIRKILAEQVLTVERVSVWTVGWFRIWRPGRRLVGCREN